MPPMLVPSRRLSLAPPGTEVEPVTGDSPLLKTNPLIIEVSAISDAAYITQKVNDYRIWLTLSDGLQDRTKSQDLHTDTDNPIQAEAQKLFLENEDHDEEYADGVESITLIYPKGTQERLESWLLRCPPRLFVYSGGRVSGGGRAVHVQGRRRTTSLEILPYCLDIEEEGWFMCLNNPRKPGLALYVPDDGILMQYDSAVPASRAKEEFERVAWEAFEGLLESAELRVQSVPYPNGHDRFPDYWACIGDEEVNVEITSVPDLKPWTVRMHYRDIEKMCRDIARNAGETPESVTADVDRVILNKKTILSKKDLGASDSKCILILANRSTIDLAQEDFWAQQDLSGFALVVLIERGKPYIVHGDLESFRSA